MSAGIQCRHMPVNVRAYGVRLLLWAHPCQAQARVAASAEGASWRWIGAGHLGGRQRIGWAQAEHISEQLIRSFCVFRERYYRSRTCRCTVGGAGGRAAVHLSMVALHRVRLRHRAVHSRHGEGRPRGHGQGQSKDEQGEQAPHVASVSASRLNRQLRCRNLLASKRCATGTGRSKVQPVQTAPRALQLPLRNL